METALRRPNTLRHGGPGNFNAGEKMAQTALTKPPSVRESKHASPAQVKFSRECFQNRDISWLRSHAQLVDEAEDSTHSLTQRLSFLAFFSEKLDGFYRVRVAAMRRKSSLPEKTEESGKNAEAVRQLRTISRHARQLVARQYRCWNHAIRPALSRAGISILRAHELDEAQRTRLDEFFLETLAPILTPLAIDSCHPKPAFVNQCLYLGALLCSRARLGPNLLFATVQLPPEVRRFIPVGGQQHNFVLLEDVIAANLHRLFGGHEVTDWSVFRFTRASQVDSLDGNPDCALCDAKSRLTAVRRGDVVRLEVSAGGTPKIVSKLVPDGSVSPCFIPGPLDLRALVELQKTLERGETGIRPARSRSASRVNQARSPDMFAKIAKRDVLLHHPWQSFTPVVNFLNQAANDPDVLSINQTLYRIGDDNPLIPPLVRAADNGKQVTALIELNAKFDEVDNIRWAGHLERDGVHVVFGFRDLKTHCKLALVVRQEADRIKRYVHLATGNYHHTTVPYTDLGLLTADDDIGADAASILNMLTGYSETPQWRKLAVAPDNLYSRTMELIQEQRDRARQGLASRIFAKVNSLTDRTVIEALYGASQDGVPIELVISGACTLRPGIANISENIRVRGIFNKYREHSRLLVFGPDEAAKVYLSSADWMPRNFHRRVEVMFPIEDPDLRLHILRSILPAYVCGSPKTRYLQPDGSYRRDERSFARASR